MASGEQASARPLAGPAPLFFCLCPPRPAAAPPPSTAAPAVRTRASPQTPRQSGDGNGKPGARPYQGASQQRPVPPGSTPPAPRLSPERGDAQQPTAAAVGSSLSADGNNGGRRPLDCITRIRIYYRLCRSLTYRWSLMLFCTSVGSPLYAVSLAWTHRRPAFPWLVRSDPAESASRRFERPEKGSGTIDPLAWMLRTPDTLLRIARWPSPPAWNHRLDLAGPRFMHIQATGLGHSCPDPSNTLPSLCEHRDTMEFCPHAVGSPARSLCCGTPRLQT